MAFYKHCSFKVEEMMRRERPADAAKRAAIIARLKGTTIPEIARSLHLSPATVKGYLANSGFSTLRTYCLNQTMADALGITAAELLAAGASWNGHYWVGRGPHQSAP